MREGAFHDYGAGIVIQAGNEPDLAATAIDCGFNQSFMNDGKVE